MKLFKLFLGVFAVMCAFSGLSAMESKAKESKGYRTADEMTKDELRVILKLVLDQLKSSKVTESELFHTTNKLRLVNKKFNSLIQEYINEQKEVKPQIYAGLTPAQAYKQFQLDMIENLIMDKASKSTYSENDLENIVREARYLKAFRWILNTHLLKKQRETLAKDNVEWKYDRSAEQIIASLNTLEFETKHFIKNNNLKKEEIIKILDDPQYEPLDEKYRKLKNLITEYKILEKIVGINIEPALNKYKDVLLSNAK